MIDAFGIFKELIETGITIKSDVYQFGSKNAIAIVKDGVDLTTIKPSILSDVNQVNSLTYVIYLNYVDNTNVFVSQSFQDELYPISATVTNFSIEDGEEVGKKLILIINEVQKLMLLYNKSTTKKLVFEPLQVNRMRVNSEFNLIITGRRNSINPLIP